jgi:hypothetical protein
MSFPRGGLKIFIFVVKSLSLSVARRPSERLLLLAEFTGVILYLWTIVASSLNMSRMNECGHNCLDGKVFGFSHCWKNYRITGWSLFQGLKIMFLILSQTVLDSWICHSWINIGVFTSEWAYSQGVEGIGWVCSVSRVTWNSPWPHAAAAMSWSQRTS